MHLSRKENEFGAISIYEIDQLIAKAASDHVELVAISVLDNAPDEFINLAAKVPSQYHAF